MNGKFNFWMFDLSVFFFDVPLTGALILHLSATKCNFFIKNMTMPKPLQNQNFHAKSRIHEWTNSKLAAPLITRHYSSSEFLLFKKCQGKM
jgi:cytochrome b561